MSRGRFERKRTEHRKEDGMKASERRKGRWKARVSEGRGRRGEEQAGRQELLRSGKGLLPGGLHPFPTSPSWRLKLPTEAPALKSALLVAPSAWTPALPPPASPRGSRDLERGLQVGAESPAAALGADALAPPAEDDVDLDVDQQGDDEGHVEGDDGGVDHEGGVGDDALILVWGRGEKAPGMGASAGAPNRGLQCLPAAKEQCYRE